jgi:beta-glucosidase
VFTGAMSFPRLSRRGLGVSAVALGALALAGSRQMAGAEKAPSQAGFPDAFRWGTATSAFQVEGATEADGRGPSIWDTFCKLQGKIRDGSNGDVADDHYHLYKEDVALMKALGTSSYRFSVAWSRLFPEGRGTPNPKGLAFYDRLVDELLANGIEPYATLYHWDLPQVLHDEGGWQSSDTPKAFADYAGFVAEKLSDRVRHFLTLNEISTFAELGYSRAEFAPGLALPLREFNQVRHHAVLAHGLGVQAVRASGRAGVKVGPAENIKPAFPVFKTPDNIRAAEQATRELNAPYLTVMLEGRYTDAYLKAAGADAPRFTDAELKTIATPVDFVGLNVYGPGEFVRAIGEPPFYALIPLPASHPRMGEPWLTFNPEALYWAPRHVAKLWNVKEIYITENGTSAEDKPNAAGRIDDLDRILYMREYLRQLLRATGEGVPVRGYFAWSLLDNFEWQQGYTSRFGLYYVDYKTQKRTPKLSASFYREIVERNALV